MFKNSPFRHSAPFWILCIIRYSGPERGTSNVPLVRLHPFSLSKPPCQPLLKNDLMTVITRKEWPIPPDDFSCLDAQSHLIAKASLQKVESVVWLLVALAMWKSVPSTDKRQSRPVSPSKWSSIQICKVADAKRIVDFDTLK